MKYPALAGCVLLLAVAGCSRIPGEPKPGVEVPRPESITSFNTLYSQNCAGCHGDHGRNGVSLDLANPVYQAWADQAAVRDVIANGKPGTQMPAFAQSAGGFLTDAQVGALVHGMRAAWGKPNALNGETPPPYTTTLKGDAARGQQVYEAACARCHQNPSENIMNPTYLALVSDQMLRTLIVAGSPDIEQPDWRGDIPGRALTDQEVTDVVAWLASKRIATPGQPYPHPNYPH
jgi:cytochrome c oxidase cbb3-type subunit 3/ubiquinol-cytochrome c reductase cytochrome c subunit